MNIDKKTKIYIAGCGGMLGESVYTLFSKKATVKATDIVLNEDWIHYADVRNYKNISKSILDFQPDLIINLAALTDLEHCEENPENAWLTNALGTENMGIIANKLNIPLVYISTAGVMDGRKDVYNDFDSPSPLGIYAKSKYYGEVFINTNVRKHFIFRAGWMMGGGLQKDKKFICKIYQQIKGGNKELFVVDDKLGTPTYTKSFAYGVFRVVQSDLYGLYNQVCTGDCSRYDVALKFVQLLDLEKTIKITKVTSNYFKKEYFAPRPSSEKLLNLKLNARELNFMPSWEKALKEYSQIFKDDLLKNSPKH